MTKLFAPPVIPATKFFKLHVPHYIQNNNTGGEGYRECNLTTHAAVVQYLTGALSGHKNQGYREPEDLYGTILAKYGDTTDHSAHTRALKDFGIESYFSYNTDLDELAQILRWGFPVTIGVDYKASGHMVNVVGLEESGFTVLCPNGIRAGSQDWWYERFTQNVHAKPDLFTWDLMKKIFTVNAHDDGWARIITSVNGLPTQMNPSVLGKRI